MNNYDIARDLIQSFTVEEIQSFVSELKHVAREKHSAHMPWMVWSREDFDPGEEFREADRAKVMNESWDRALNNRNLMDCLDYDWERVHMIRDEVVEELNITEYGDELSEQFRENEEEILQAIETAKGLNEYGTNEKPNVEYLRGQVELICYMYGLLPADGDGDIIEKMILAKED